MIAMKKRLFTLYLLGWMLPALLAQNRAVLTHYSTEDGLSQNTVMDILQDREGNMWFSTWDGLNRFDGYEFRTFKARERDGIALSHNRIDHMREDGEGYLWLLTYDNHIYRFDPRTEQLQQVPESGQEASALPLTDIVVLRGGSVWLLSQKEGAIRVRSHASEGTLHTTWFSPRHSRFPVERMNTVFEDSQGREWLLTDNGLAQIDPDSDGEPTSYFLGKGNRQGNVAQAFHAAAELGGALFFGSDKGRVWRFDNLSGEFSLVQLTASSSVVSLQAVADNLLLMVTATDGLFLYDILKQQVENHWEASLLPRAPVLSAYRDRQGEIWLEQEVPGTVAHFNAQTRHIQVERMRVESTYTPRSYPAFHIHEDVRGTVWVHPYGGGFSYYDRQSGRLKAFHNALDSDDWRFSNKIHAAYSDRQGNLWLSTHSKGLEKITFHTSDFRMETPVPDSPYETLSNEVRALCHDRQGHIWLGTKDGRLWMSDLERQVLGYLTEQGTVAKQGNPLYGTVYDVMEGRQGTIWISTKGAGLVKAEPTGRPLAYRLTRYRTNPDDIYSLSDDDVYDTYEDRHGRIWVATFAGGVNYLTRDEQGRDVFISHRNRLKGYPIETCYKSRCITGDLQGNIWIGTTVGALRVADDFCSPGEARFYHYEHRTGHPDGLAGNDVLHILSTESGELYLATFGGGLNRLKDIGPDGSATFQAYTMADGLPSDVLLALCADRQGNLWMSTDNSISKFIPGEQRFENFSCKKEFPHIRFNEATILALPDGQLTFGTNLGALSFQSDSLSKSSYVPPMVFSGVRIAGEGIGNEQRPIAEGQERLVLAPDENIFTLQFAALDYTDPQAIRYAYLLEGFETAWNLVGNRRTATYTNLPPGEYRFRVRSTNSDGVWTGNERSLAIVVKPAWHETVWAYLLYILLLLLLVLGSVYVLFTIYRLRHKVEVERQVSDLKLRFFTDVSHELRTPLTLIAGPVEYLLQQKELPEALRPQMEVVERNTQRMLRLVNQILDFRKIQNRKMKMQVQCLPLVSFTRRIMHHFDTEAEQHRISFLLDADTENVRLYVDADKYEKILYNLLSNAFKYTPDGGSICVFIHEEEQAVSVGVKDSGIGIPENKRNSIFLRFENLVDHRPFLTGSTGIGLSLVRELVQMHGATIQVESQEGKGSCFTVRFLKGKAHYDESVEFLQSDGVEAPPAWQPDKAGSEEPTKDDTSTRETMLLVEDNAELRLFLRGIFASEYRIVEATNGREGWEKALNLLPDIIISDIMMPEKDGLELTRDLRRELTTSHIPIVLLTAKTSFEKQLEGLAEGADDYITKPFSAVYLQARVRNLLAQRQKLQKSFRMGLMADASADAASVETPEQSEQATPATLSDADRKFMERVVQLMEKNMDNGNLVVDDLVSGVAVSRSVFFKKIKSLTGLAPVEFIREMRIRRAAQLIAQGDYTMTQIAYMVGISDSRYFSKCFKQLMGMTPTEYKERNRK